MLYQLIVAVLLSAVTAWPTVVFGQASLIYNATDANITANLQKAYSLLKVAPRQLSFDPYSQYVSTTSQYAFQPPNYAAGDQRGNCPGLNALANHGYLPRNGVGTVAQFADAVNRVYNMGFDAGIFLGTFGSVMTGDLTKFSIGGPTPLVPNLLGLGLLGTPQGISSNSSHSKYEGDASSTRGDLFLIGDSSRLQMPYFKQLFDMQPDPATANYNMNIIIPFHAARFYHSIMNNRYFFNSPLAGLIGVNAAHNFVFRLFANHSAEYPDGILNQEVLKSFFSVSGPRSNFIYKHGYERIPSQWYKRSTPYTLVSAAADIVAAGLVYPPLVSVGGNTGQVNTFTGVSLGQLTGSTFNAATLLQGNNALCFALQTARFATPDVIVGPGSILSPGGLLGSGGLLGGLLGGVVKPVLSPVTAAINNLAGIVTDILSDLSCPDLRTYDKTVFDRFASSVGV